MPVEPAEPLDDPDAGAIAGFGGFASRFAGATVDGGLYRVHSRASAEQARALVAAAFPEFPQAAARCFGFDWLGCQFALDTTRVRDGEPEVVVFEPGTGDALQIPATFREFHERLAKPEFREPALQASFHAEWRAAGAAALAFSDCAGYRVPLFLGGRDEVENLDRSDIDVYWTLTGQLLEGTRGLPAGTRITGVQLKAEE